MLKIGTVRKRVCGDVKVLHTFFLCVEHIWIILNNS